MTSLRWLQPDEYHIRTECGRFSVARRRVNGVDWYIANRIEPTVDVERAHEIGATQVTPRATGDERLKAISAMREICEAAAIEQLSTNH